METINTTTTVGEIIRAYPGLSSVFEKYHIDYCCGGKLPLEQACAKANINAEKILEELASKKDIKNEDSVNADDISLSELADHITNTHHFYLKNELPRLDQITARVLHVHGDKDQRLQDVRNAFVSLKDEMLQHMTKEERVLFPMIKELETANAAPAHSIAGPIRQMEHEHDGAGDALSIISKATDNYTPPVWACNTYRVMIDSLKKLELDMHQHVHKENNILFAKALKLESSFGKPACNCSCS